MTGFNQISLRSTGNWHTDHPFENKMKLPYQLFFFSIVSNIFFFGLSVFTIVLNYLVFENWHVLQKNKKNKGIKLSNKKQFQRQIFKEN